MKTKKEKIKHPKMQRYTFKDFENQFPNDDACLDWLKDYLYPDGIFCETCDKVTKHHKVTSRRSYSCQYCGHHVHPTADTIYHKSSTSLKTWFHAIFLMASTRCGISAKQLERETGVTYKTAWRMFKQVRTMLNEDRDPFSGQVEVDETFIGGLSKNMHKDVRARKITGTGGSGKIAVAGMVQREGAVIAKVITDRDANTLMPFVEERVLPSTIVYTDELPAYNGLKNSGYEHRRVHHSAKVYVQGDAHTNSIEGFWSLVKNGVRGVNHSVSAKYLQTYLDEYAFRYSRRFNSTPMFESFLTQVRRLAD
jgi:transposase-like protein